MEHRPTLWAFLGCLVILILHHVARKCSKRRVREEANSLLPLPMLTLGRDLELAKAYGCQSPPRLLNQWPLGIDRIEQIFRANSESRLMELFLFHFRFWGNTLEHKFLGTPAYGTVEPANLEALLSTNVQGMVTPGESSVC